ncbi:ABC transporter ATP-binding protein [Candidatus Bipolaricaulota bacterium]|nr:ABC transporter ATP-binding protein [Candidatus Bipolaricaulota bacterium]
MLVVENLAKQFGGLHAVDGCSFTVKQGTITGLIGPNGAGKTTVFNLLTGFLKPDSGEVHLAEEDITGLPPHRIFQKRICRTFQIPRELKEMTVMENLMLVPPGQIGERIWNPFFRPRRVHRQERTICDKAFEVLDFLQLSHLKDEYAGSLSGGQKKLLELARTMMVESRLVMLDEPGAGVNRTLLKRLASSIERLCGETGTTFLVVEHDMDFIMRLCTPVIVMSEGRKLMEGTPEEVQQDQQVLDAYLGGQYVAIDG